MEICRLHKWGRRYATALVSIAGLHCGLTLSVAAGTSYFDVDVESSVYPINNREGWSGYARLEFTDAGEIAGKLCMRGREPQPLNGGKTPRGTIQLHILGLQDLGVGTDLLEFENVRNIGGECIERGARLHCPPSRNSNWYYSPPLPPDIVASPSRKSNRIYSPPKVSGPEIYSIALYEHPTHTTNAAMTRRETALAAMDLGRAFREETRRPTRTIWAGGIAPGQITVVVDADKSADLNRFLPSIKAKPLDQEVVANPCGIPTLTEEVNVVPLLESWSAAKVKSSGLAISAHVIGVAGGPSTLALTTKSGRFLRVVAADTRPVDVRDAELSDEINKLLVSFASARQAKFRTFGSVTRLIDNTPFFYRFEIKGLSLARCEPNRWEKVVLQMFLDRSLTNDRAVGIILQIQEGFFAMSPSDQPPPDSRYDENRIPDGDLTTLEQRVASYLISRGFEEESPGIVENQGRIACT